MKKSILLQAFNGGKNTSVPVWFMRQAGRYLPQYRAIKAKHSLEEMFETPDIAAEITCQPVDILGVDAAILFADILTLPKLMGLNVHFDKEKGPVLEELKNLKQLKDFREAPYLKKTIETIQARLKGNVPLIGFAGGPFTVATYMIEGGSSVNFPKTLNFMYSHPEEFLRLMDLLTKNTIVYLNYQKSSGIDVFQLFDTWAGILSKKDYDYYVLPSVKKIFTDVKLPSIYFAKNNSHLLSSLVNSKADFLSLCHTVDMKNNAVLQKSKMGIQGNLFNGYLYSDYPVLEKEIKNVLSSAQKFKRYIFNLSHGLMQDMDVEKVKFIVKKVHEYSWPISA